MIVLSNTTAQTLTPGQAITFDTVVLHTGNGECHRPGTSSIKMRDNGIYDVDFHGNISSATAGDVTQMNIEVGGDALAETTMTVTTPVANYISNISAGTKIKNCCCDFDRLTVVNTGSTTVTIQANSCFEVKRVS